MDEKLQQKLFDKYPLVYKNRSSLMQNFGICVANGWYDLLDELSSKIEKLLSNDSNYSSKFKIIQIKTKFGGLRFYFTPSIATNRTYDSIWNIVRDFENDSVDTCEHCGIKGKTQNIDNWMYTLCDSCAVKESDRRKQNINNLT